MALEMQNFEALSPPAVKKNNLVDINPGVDRRCLFEAEAEA